MKTILIIFLLLISVMITEAQEYTDLFPNSRAPYRFRIYEREVLKAKEIARVDTINVWKYLNVVWMQGLYQFSDSNKILRWKGWQHDADLKEPLGNIVYPTYYYLDTVYVVPTLEGFEKWKLEKGY